MRHTAPLAILTALAAISSATAGEIKVLVEPYTPAGAQAVPPFTGKLLSPTTVTLLPAAQQDGIGPLDLTRVLVLTFTTPQDLDEIDAQVQALSDAQDKLKGDDANKALVSTLQKRIDALTGKKKDLTDNSVRAITTYKSVFFTGKSIKEEGFTIEVGSDDPPKTYPVNKLKAIYFIPKTAVLAPPAAKNDDMAALTGTWVAIAQQLKGLKHERALVASKYSRVVAAVERMKYCDADGRQPVSKEEATAGLDDHLKALRESIHAKDLLIGVLQVQLAALPRPNSIDEPYEAFWRKPYIQAVPEYEDFKEDDLLQKVSEKSPYASLKDRVTRTRSTAFDYRFDHPASFPLPQFAAYGERVDTEGVVIHEGMRFVATADGQYEVSFTTSIPKMPVTLRMQLLFAGEDGCAHTLTLPPITIDPYPDFQGNYPGESFQVHHAGHSHMLAEYFRDLGDMTVARQGSARFGSWPEGINRFGIVTSSAGIAQTAQSMSTAPTAP